MCHMVSSLCVPFGFPFFAEQVEGDIAGEKKQIEEAKEGIADLQKELEKLKQKGAASEVRLSMFRPARGFVRSQRRLTVMACLIG